MHKPSKGMKVNVTKYSKLTVWTVNISWPIALQQLLAYVRIALSETTEKVPLWVQVCAWVTDQSQHATVTQHHAPLMCVYPLLRRWSAWNRAGGGGRMTRMCSTALSAPSRLEPQWENITAEIVGKLLECLFCISCISCAQCILQHVHTTYVHNTH